MLSCGMHARAWLIASALGYGVFADFEVDDVGEVILLQTALNRSELELGQSDADRHERLAVERHGMFVVSNKSHADRIGQEVHLNQSGASRGNRHEDARVNIWQMMQTLRISNCSRWFLALLISVASTLAWQFRYLPEKMFAPDAAGQENLHAAGAPQQSLTSVAFPIVCVGVVYIAVSSVLIKYNQWLMTDHRFPFAVNLTLNHQIFGSTMLGILYNVNPSLFPSLRGPAREKNLSRRTISFGIVPVALSFGGMLVLSNTAYMYGTVAFLQMMKEGNMVLVYSLSLIVGLEAFESTRARVLLCLLCSTALTIQGEIQFSIAAFTVQGTSQLLEAIKIVTQSLLLSGAGSHHMDPLTYNILVQPITAFILCIFLSCVYGFIHRIPVASLDNYIEWAPHLILNASVALALNFIIALFMKMTSAVGYIVMGILKDVSLIIVDVMISGTQLSDLQILAFGFQIVFASSYALLRHDSKAPDEKPIDVDSNKKLENSILNKDKD